MRLTAAALLLLASCCLSALTWTPVAWAQPHNQPIPPTQKAPGCDRERAQWLADRGEHFRAVGILLDCRFSATDPIQQALLERQMATLYLSARQYLLALDAFDRAADLDAQATLSADMALNKAIALYHARRLSDARAMLEQPLPNADPRLIATQHAYNGLLSIQAEAWDEARGHFTDTLRTCAEATPAPQKPWTACRLAARNNTLLGTPPPRPLSPWLAGVASAVVPGSGQLYAGSGIDTLYYISLIGLAAFVAVDTYNSDEPLADQQASFYLVSGLGLFIYSANIVGAYNGAVRTNTVAKERYRNRLLSEPTPRPGDPGHPILTP
ncbi:MAG: hypothetical protein AAFS10_13200 [Myxococcota bacterium]